MSPHCWRKFIFWFAQEHVDFRIAEILSITKLLNVEIKINENTLQKPFWIVELAGEHAARLIASRSVSLRCVLELWGHSNLQCELHKKVRAYVNDRKAEVGQLFSIERSFKITVETYNKHFSQKEKVDKIESFAYLPFEGKVNLKTPDVEWYYIEFWGLNPKDVPKQPHDVFFGKWISDGQRNLIKELSLKRRKFIGNTSMDTQLSLLMANQAMVKRGDFVFDPFVGSGSLLVSAAKFGAFVLGADIDYLMIHAKSRPSRITQKVREKDESIKNNLKQYNCEQYYIDALVSDFSNSIWREEILFDSIITDPPYGIRESIEKVELKIPTKPPRKDNVPHYPSTSHYSLQSLYSDLLEFSAKHLRLQGRLVCWLPVYREDYREEFIPKHGSLKLLYNSEQILTGMTSRRLLTYEKISEPALVYQAPKVVVTDFRSKYFSYSAETRAERRIKKAQLRELGRIEAVKRGKSLDENGKVIKNKKNTG